jgi:hypothetical protein
MATHDEFQYRIKSANEPHAVCWNSRGQVGLQRAGVLPGVRQGEAVPGLRYDLNVLRTRRQADREAYLSMGKLKLAIGGMRKRSPRARVICATSFSPGGRLPRTRSHAVIHVDSVTSAPLDFRSLE